MQRKYLLTTASILALSGTAYAAPPSPPPAPSWTGFYLGIEGGGVWSKATLVTAHNLGSAITTSGAFTTSGGIFGALIGYNWQVQNIVLGLEADDSWSGANGSTTTTNSVGGKGTFASQLNWLATVRGRAGILVTPATLLYATAGVAVGRIQNTETDLQGFAEATTKSGWTGGGGVEYRFAQQWSAKAEALFVSLGSTTIQGTNGPGYLGTFRNSATIARGGISFHW